jgi:hypothetical protein
VRASIAFLVLRIFGMVARVGASEMPWVRVADDKRGFMLEVTKQPFVPMGFNYDHDPNGRLIEDYWETEWPMVEVHFTGMKALGANVVRVHLQLGKFMEGPEKPSEQWNTSRSWSRWRNGSASTSTSPASKETTTKVAKVAQNKMSGAGRANVKKPSAALDQVIAEIERDIDRLIFKLITLGDLPDIEDGLRQIRRQLVLRSHTA